MKSAVTLTAIATLSLAILSGCSKGPSPEEQQRLEQLQTELAAKEAQIAAEQKKAAELAEAARLAEEAAAKAREAESARLKELADQYEKEKQEKARLAGMVENLNAKTKSTAEEQKRLQDALAKARADREQSAIEANEKVKAAQAKLAQVEASKQDEIAQAREAALAEAVANMQSRAEKGGYTAATDVITNRQKESVRTFLSITEDNENFRNNTRRLDQRRVGE